MVDKDPSVTEHEFDIYKALEVAKRCEDIARSIDEDYAEGFTDGMSVSGGSLDFDGDLSAVTGLTVRRVREEIDGKYIGDVRKTVYLFESRVRCTVGLRHFPAIIRGLVFNQFEEEFIQDPTTEFSIEYTQDYSLSDDGDLHFDCDLRFCLDGMPVDLESSETKDGDTDADTVATDIDDELELLLAEEDLDFLSNIDDSNLLTAEDIDIMTLFEDNMNQIRFASKATHLENIARLAEQFKAVTKV